VDREALTLRVREIAAEHFGVELDQVRPESHLISDLGGDGLDVIELILELEDEFEVGLNDPDPDYEDAETIQSLVTDLIAATPAPGNSTPQ